MLASFALVRGFEVIDYFIYTFVGCVFREALDLGQRGLLEINFVLFASEHALMVHEYFFWKPFKNPFMLERLKRSHSVNRVPIEALVYKVQKLSVATLAKHALKSLGVRNPFATAAVGYNNREKGVFFEKKMSAGGQLYDVIGWNTLNLHHVCELFSLVFTREQRVSCIQLRHYATKAPHVNSGGIRDT